MTLLVTGFEPFGPWVENPTADVAAAVADRLGGRSLVLPVDLQSAPGRLLEALDDEVTALLCLGLHGASSEARVERGAWNLADFRIPDNAGRTVRSVRLLADAPDGLLSAVDVHQVAARIGERGIPVALSSSAGTYLCNAVYFFALVHSACPVLFLHLPPLPGQARSGVGPEEPVGVVRGMALQQQIEAAVAAASCLLETT